MTGHTYQIQMAPSALRSLRKLDRALQVRIAHTIDSLSVNPRPHGAVKLSTEENLYRVRAGDYRIIYSIQDAVLIVLVVAIGHRRDVYR